LPVCDTVSGQKAAEAPAESIRHYEKLAEQLWLPPQVRQLADGVLAEIRGGRTQWASISGPYGYGKTAAGIAAWRHARDQGFTAIPPLSCSNFGELAQGIAALASISRPKDRGRIEKLFRRVWDRGLDQTAQADARKYELPSRKVRRLLQDKLQAGQISLDGQCHRLVEFLSELGRLTATWSHGLVIVMDELQQLLGPLDMRSVIQFREFVWGMRTEQSPCGVVVCLDAMLEARLARWAADLLHRIRESGPTLQLAEVYTREFPNWLWTQLTTANGTPARADSRALSPSVLVSLGQFVERPDLANGPRTVVDVFCRAISRFQDTTSRYDIGDLVADLHDGVFRYFGEGAPVQRTLTELLKDDWLGADQDRTTLVRTLAAFPRGCPAEIAAQGLSSPARLQEVRADLFGPLLIELPEGLALERLQQVRRPIADWEHVLARCWETLPAQDSLFAHAADMVWRVLAARLFPEAPGAGANWERTTDESVTALTGWRFLRGSFDEDFPRRDVALWIGSGAPTEWPDSVDLAVAMVCDASPTAETASLLETEHTAPRLTLCMPLLRPLQEYVPPELDRYRKYLQPEPFRGMTIIAALHELESLAGRLSSEGSRAGDEETAGPLPALRSFVSIAVAFLLREMFQGSVNLGPKVSVKQRGVELVRALFSAACRHKFPEYRTLVTHHRWDELLDTYRKALRTESISDLQRRGDAAVEGPKGELLRTLLGQKSVAAGDSFLRLLGPLVEASGTASAFTLRFTLHPGETLALDYLWRTGRKRAVPLSAVQEVLRHGGYLPTEAEALVHVLIDRGLVARGPAGLRPVVADRSESERARQEIDALTARLRTLVGPEDTPELQDDEALRGLWAHLDRLQETLQSAIDAMHQGVQRKADRLRELLGAVRAEIIPLEWMKSEIAAHLKGIAKLLGRTREGLIRGLEREAGRIDEELALTGDEEWALGWKKRAASCERIWRELEQRFADFLKQAAAVRAWLPVNERLVSLAALGAKIATSDAALARSVSDLAVSLRERFATDNWGPVYAHADVAVQLGVLEAQAQGLLFSRLQAYSSELDTLRVRFNDFLSGPAPQITVPECRGKSDDRDPNFTALYTWAIEGFAAALDRLRARKEAGTGWKPPFRKSQSWSDIDGQMDRAVAAAHKEPSFQSVTRVGEILLLMRQGFAVAAEERGEAVYEGADAAVALGDVERLLAEGRVRVRVEWIDPPERKGH
jgi:hypothetical protein